MDGDSKPIGRFLLGGKDGYKEADVFREAIDGALCKCRLKLGGEGIFCEQIVRESD